MHEYRACRFLRTTDKTSSVLDQAGFKRLEDVFISLRPDLVVIDPLVVLCGGGNINDNAAMSLVIRELKRLAINFDCAILIIHHTNKGGEPGKAEAVTGASAIVNLARRAIMPVTMTDDEAIKLKVWPSQRHAYFKVVNAKSNLAPRTDDTPWYRLNNVTLPNAEPPTYEHGDGVQAVERVVAQFARSLGPQYDVTEHPSLSEFVSGLLWDHDNGGSGLPLSAEGLAELKRRFPPRQLEGLSSYSWSRPTRKKRKKKGDRLPNRARYDELKSKRFEPAKLHHSALEHAKPNQNTHKDAGFDQTAAVPDAVRRAMALAESFYGAAEK